MLTKENTHRLNSFRSSILYKVISSIKKNTNIPYGFGVEAKEIFNTAHALSSPAWQLQKNSNSTNLTAAKR